jgi:hypothetical protein
VEFEIVSRGITKKQKRKNHEESRCHHDQQRPRSDGPAYNLDCSLLLRRESSLGRRRCQQGMPPAVWTWLHTDCCLSHENGQFEISGLWKRCAISREINLAATLRKSQCAKLPAFEVEQARR